MSNNYYAIIMAGGLGSRFWPISTSDMPKQFLDIFSTGETLIQKTFNRLSKIIPKKNIYILTNDQYEALVLKQLPDLQKEQLLLEPEIRNTAPCILYASLKIKKINANAVVTVVPSDHWIENETYFANDLKGCFQLCEKKSILMTLGVIPTFPNTGYGYIQHEDNIDKIKKVKKFREKPDYETAKKFLNQGCFLWNSGIFIWHVNTILEALKEYQRGLYDLFLNIDKHFHTENEINAVQEWYPKAPNISIDCAVMEHAMNIYVLPVSFDWNDLGTWGAVYNELPHDKNRNAIMNSFTLLEESNQNMIYSTSKHKTIVVRGLNNYIVVDTNDKLLIYPKDKEQEIRQISKKLVE